MKKILSLITAMFILASMAVAPVYAEGMNAVTVNTVDGLLNAIASNTEITVQEGKYIIPSTIVNYDGYEYEEGQSVLIDGIENLEIKAQGNVEIALAVGYIPVIDIINSKNITLTGLTLGHDVPEYSCIGEGDVVSVSSSDNVTINHCDLYGCGIFGIVSFNSGDLKVNYSIIRDCANGALFLQDMHGSAEFNNCSFLRNTYDQEYAKYSPCFSFSSISQYNMPEYADVKSKAVFNDCIIEDNFNGYCYEEYDVEVEFNNCTERNNVWQNRIGVGIITPDLEEGQYMEVEFTDQEPVIINDRTLVPVRGIFEHEVLGFTVDWDQATTTATISNGTITVVIPVGSNVIYKNDEPITIDVPAQVINDRTMLPVRAISEAFGLQVDWDQDLKMVLITVE